MSDFNGAFEALTGHKPFPWQRRLFNQMSTGKLPSAVDIPTGLGKTAVMAIWLLSRAKGADLPRRLVYVVDRRAVVDQATQFAETLRDNLQDLGQIRKCLGLGDRQLPISTLRGRYVDNREWLEDPATPAIIVGTVDMIGSRLLFEGYGVSRRMRPYVAGFMGCDTLIMLDEAHLSRPFERLLREIEKGCRVNDGDKNGDFVGTEAHASLPPPLRILPLSATLSGSFDSMPFTLGSDDRKHKIVAKRLDAKKELKIEDLKGNVTLDQLLVERSWQLAYSDAGQAHAPLRILIYCDKRTVAKKVKDGIQNLLKKEKSPKGEPAPTVILFVGGRRVYEREEAAKQLKAHGLIAGTETKLKSSVFLVATSAGEVGVDLDADHMVCDLVAWERMVQRLGRVNRRGMRVAQVLVIDQDPAKAKEDNNTEEARRHNAVKELLMSLPLYKGNHHAGPAALVNIGKNPDHSDLIRIASTPMPLYPAPTRSLVDSWAMTSVVEHTGRPEVIPWLRGWVDDDDAQTIVVWRRYLPIRFSKTDTIKTDTIKFDASKKWRKDVEDFFDATSPQTSEMLETSTNLVLEWLIKRARKVINKKALAESAINSDRRPLLAYKSPIAFLLNNDHTLEDTISLQKVDGNQKKWQVRLQGRILVVDARLCGLDEGLLDYQDEKEVLTSESNWADPGMSEVEVLPERDKGIPLLPRVRLVQRNEYYASHNESVDGSEWKEILAIPYQVQEEDDLPKSFLVIDKWRGATVNEESRAVSSGNQILSEHHEWTADKAGRIAKALNLPAKYQTMLVVAARCHDQGKEVERWQNAFNAPSDGRPYAKTKGPVNQHILSRYRHEFQSVIDAENNGLNGLKNTDHQFDLALHLIAAHHGNARPAIGIESCDALPPTEAEHVAHEIAQRFARLNHQWGPWGLAWWEALLRAADQQASRAFDSAT